MLEDEKSLRKLEELANLNYNAGSFIIETKDANNILNYIRRMINLMATYEVLIDKQQDVISCEECPLIKECLEVGHKADECQLRVLTRCKTLEV